MKMDELYQLVTTELSTKLSVAGSEKKGIAKLMEDFKRRDGRTIGQLFLDNDELAEIQNLDIEELIQNLSHAGISNSVIVKLVDDLKKCDGLKIESTFVSNEKFAHQSDDDGSYI